MSIDFKSINRHRGDFTKKAASAGMGVQEYARNVLANTGSYDTRTVRQASFAKAATKFNHHALGGGLNIYAGDEPERVYNNTTLMLNAMRGKDYSSGYGSLADMELRDSLVANPNFILEKDKGGRYLRNTAESIASYDGPSYAQTLRRNGLLQQDKLNFLNFDADRAERVRARMLEKGRYNEKQIATVINALHDETPNSDYRMGWWYRDKEGKLRKSRTERDDAIAWDVGPFQFTDNKMGAEEGTKYLDWCKENHRDPYNLDDGLDYFLDIYLPRKLADKPEYAKMWEDPDEDVSRIGSGFLKHILSGNNRNNAVWLEKKGRMARQIYEHRPGSEGGSSAEVIPSPLTPVIIDNGGVSPAPLLTPHGTEVANDPYFVYGSYPPRDVKTDQSGTEPVRTDMSGNPGVFAAGGELAHSHGAWWPNGLQFVNAGGTHEQNPNMGVQVGVDGEGTPNLVEEGEVIYNDYVFSNRLYPTKKELEEANLPVSYAKKTFAYIAERMGRESEERPNDAVSRRGLEAMLQRLAGIQERQRQERGLVGTQQMEQGTGMPQMPQGMSPEDMLAMQGGGQIPPEMLAQAAGGGYGQPDGYAPDGGEAAPEGYGGEGYMSAYGGPLVSVFRHGGHKRGSNRRTEFTAGEIENDDYARNGNGMRLFDNEKGQEIYDKKYRKKFNRVLNHMDNSVLQHGIGSRSYDDMIHSLYGGQGQTGDEQGRPDDDIIGPTMRAEPDEVNGGVLNGAVVVGRWPNHNKWYGANERLKTEDNDGNPYPLLEPGTLNGSIMRPEWQVDRLEVNNNGDLSAFNGTYFTSEDESNKSRNYKRLAKTDAVRDALGWVRAQIDRGAEGKDAESPPHIDAYGGNIYAFGSPMDLFYSTLPQRLASFNSMLNEIRAPFYPSGITPGKIPVVKGAPGATGKPEPLPTNMRYASAMGPAVSALVNAFRRPDNSEARAYESVAANVPNVSVRPRMLSSYMAYTPLSREFALNPVRAQAGATRRANVGLNAGQANALNLALNYQTAPLMGQAIANTDTQNLERMKAVYDFNRQTDMTNAQNDLAAQTTNAQNALQRYNLVASLRSQAAKARSQERADLEEARTQSLAGVFSNLGAIGKENLAYNQVVSSNMYYNPLTDGTGVYVGGPTGTTGNVKTARKACGGMLTRRRKTKRAGR